jgi:hypothetical protein
MTALNDFIDDRIPKDVALGRDYAGGRGWISLCNIILRRLENEGLIQLTQKKEVGVEVSNDRYVAIPSDYRSDLEIFSPVKFDGIPFEIVNGLIRLDGAFSKKEDPDTFVLSLGTALGVSINDTDAVEDEWNGWLLVLTNGTYSGDTAVIGQHPAASVGVTALNFLFPRSTSVVTSTAGYLTDAYLRMRYMAAFTGLTAYTDDIPVDERYENVLINGLCYLSKPVDSKERKAYRAEFENDLDLLKDEIFTPTPEQARPSPRSMPALEDCSTYPRNRGTFVGDENA